jgi:hypothetical protein
MKKGDSPLRRGDAEKKPKREIEAGSEEKAGFSVWRVVERGGGGVRGEIQRK